MNRLKIPIWLSIALIVAFALLPYYLHSQYWLRIVNMILLNSILVMSLNLIVGFTGQLSFGHAAFYGVGGYTAALMLLHTGVPFPIIMVLSGIIAAIVGLGVGFPVMRFKGDYLALVSLGFAQIFWVVAQNWMSITRGPRGLPGIPAPVIFGLQLVTNTHFFYLGLILAAITMIFMMLLVKSYVGRALLAVREDERAAVAMGINPMKYKLLSFTIGSFFAGIAGSFLASYLGFVGPMNFTLDQSILYVMMVIVGGLGSLWGSVVGAAIIVILTQLFSNLPGLQMLLVGIIIAIAILVRPQGIMGNPFVKGAAK
ncbi:MAG: branched-chain amino acid ABC transporter permease [Bacillota bacterium]